MNSKMSEQIMQVLKELKENIYAEANLGEGIKVEDAELQMKEVFKKIAERMKVTPSTIMDKCTRQLELNVKEFNRLAVEYITNQNDDLEQRVVDYSKPSLDDETRVRKDMRSIRIG